MKSKFKVISLVSSIGALLFPVLAFAQIYAPATPNTQYIDSSIAHARSWLSIAVSVLLVLMTIFFLYQVLRFIMNKDATKSADYRKTMINGLIGLFVAVSVWGIVHLAGSIFGLDQGSQSNGYTVVCPPGMSPDPLQPSVCH